MIGDSGLWLRKQCMILAQNGNGDADSWLAMPICDLGDWIEANNIIIEERRQEVERRGKR